MLNEDSGTSQDIDKLRERHKILETQKITAEANLRTSQATLEKLQKQARETYGTDNLEDLRAKLEAMKLENERKREDYQQHLADIERQLGEVERQHAEATRKENKG